MNHTLFFNYINDQGVKVPMLFTNPERIIIAYTIEEVLPSLHEIQEAVNDGYYAAGYLSYEAAPAFEPTYRVNQNSKMPLLWFGIFKKPENKTLHSNNDFYTSEWLPQTDLNTYNHSIDQIKNYIEQGDTYQVNYTIRLQSQFYGDPIAYYQQLAQSQSANYSAFLDIGDYSILSASPELFFHLKDNNITTKPMKGTIGRGNAMEEDQENADWLFHSKKNRAENVMIVDLLRNDLGRIAKPGSVQVPKLFSIEKYPTVYQMTSTVTAEIEKNNTIGEIFKALFPCGSITGAPKVSTMSIIEELEASPREVYCGTIGFITPEQEAIFNVPIRTVMIEHETNQAQYGVGGGITWDSTNKEEYEEVLTKAKILTDRQEPLQLIETIGLRNGKYIVLDDHLERLKQTAAYFHFDVHINQLKKALQDIATKHPTKFWKVRVLVSRDGEFDISTTTTEPIKDVMNVAISKEPVSKDNIFLYHKTTNRQIYEEMAAYFPDAFDVLLWNEDSEITEFTRGNVVVELDGDFYTPPVSCGLLGGTYREDLLRKGIIKERTITTHELKDCTSIWFINSVREWVPVTISN